MEAKPMKTVIVQARRTAAVLAALVAVPTALLISCRAGDKTSTTQPLGPSQLAFVASPSNAQAGTVIKPAIQVVIQDADGNTVVTAVNSVTITLANNNANATLSGTTTVTAVGGVAIFSDLSIDKPQQGYVLAASSPDLTTASSPSFTINPVPLPPTNLQITTTTTGASFPTGYGLTVDCDSYGCAYNGNIVPNGMVALTVYPGDHYVALTNVPDNCTLSGDASRTITVSGQTNVVFSVACAATGPLTVTTATGGTDITPDGYTICVDRSANSCYWHAPAAPNDAVTINGVVSGPHNVALTNVGGNCAVSGGASHSVSVPATGTVTAPFSITCSLTERLAFSLNGAISMVHTDGTATHFIIGNAHAPAWSPDGARVAFECSLDLCAVNADGTNLSYLTTNGAGNHHPTWSPDGLKIAFTSAVAGGTDLYVVATSGGSPVQLTQGVGVLGNAAWSPDGTQIAFDCQVDAGNSDICVVHADGTGFTRLTNDPAADYGAAWKPDGSTLAFSTTRFGVDEVVLMSSTGGSVTRFGAGLPGFSPTWSPDGTQLAFVQLFNDPLSGPYENVVAMHADGSSLHTVTRGAEPAWRPHK